MKQILSAWMLALLLVSPAYAAEGKTGVAIEQGHEAVAHDANTDGHEQGGINSATKEKIGDITRELSTLDAEDKAALRHAIQDGIELDINADTSVSESIIAIVAIVLSLGMPIIIVAMALYAAYRKRKQRTELITTFVENNREIPSEILQNLDAFGGEKNNLQGGLIAIGLGLGLLFGLGLLAGWEVGALGLIPFFLGLAKLLIWKMEGNNE